MMKRSRLKRMTPGNAVILVVLTVLTLMIVIPFINAITISFITQDEYLSNRFALIPREPTVSAYQSIFRTDWLAQGYVNTITIVSLAWAYCIAICVLTAYALTRKFPLKKLFYVYLIIPMFFGGGLIPTYLLLVGMGLKNTYGALILPAGVSTYYLMIMSTFFREIPESLTESARLDGASEFRILRSIILPLSTSVLATISLFIVVGFWNEWFSAMIYLDKPRAWPLQLHLRSIINKAESQMMDKSNMSQSRMTQKVYAEGVRMAAVIVTMLPIMLVYPFLQKYFVKGIMIGAVKG